MLFTGLCSVSFRRKTVDEIVSICEDLGIRGIEWGADIHVPAGDITNARIVGDKTRAAGLEVCAYGSYFKCDGESGDVRSVLDTAAALGAPVVRVWAGAKGSSVADIAYRVRVAQSIRETVELASERGMSVALEYHEGTLTDTVESALDLIQLVDHPELRLFWQSRGKGDFLSDVAELDAMLPLLENVHCFHWGATGWDDKRGLSEGIQEWTEFLRKVASTRRKHYVCFEFIKGDSVQQLRRDVQTLLKLLQFLV